MLPELIIGAFAIAVPFAAVMLGVPWRIAMIVPPVAIVLIGYRSGVPEQLDQPMRTLIWVMPAVMTYLMLLLYGRVTWTAFERRGLRW